MARRTKRIRRIRAVAMALLVAGAVGGITAVALGRGEAPRATSRAQLPRSLTGRVHASNPNQLRRKVNAHYRALRQYGLEHPAVPTPDPSVSQGPDSAWPEGIQTDIDQFSPRYNLVNGWEHSTDQENIAVYAGAFTDDPSQGVVFVLSEQRDTYQFSSDAYPTPTSDGSVTITAAAGNILTLTADDGTTFTFDVDSRTFS